MKHYSKEEFKRRIKAFKTTVTERLEQAKQEFEGQTKGSFYKTGWRAGKIEALEEIKKALVAEFDV